VDEDKKKAIGKFLEWLNLRDRNEIIDYF